MAGTQLQKPKCQGGFLYELFVNDVFWNHLDCFVVGYRQIFMGFQTHNKAVSRSQALLLDRIQKFGNEILGRSSTKLDSRLCFVEIIDPKLQKLFDCALDTLHYAGSCQRVGRCMRIAIVKEAVWVGGIVLGSPFPNVLARDEALGLRKFVLNYRRQGLKSPWARRNIGYWRALQRIVNHARTFIFPEFQGLGIGTKAHRLMSCDGIVLWEKKYGGRVRAIDALCAEKDANLYKRNGWLFAGWTKGYTSDPKKVFSKQLANFKGKTFGARNNVGLSNSSTRWMVWVKEIAHHN